MPLDDLYVFVATAQMPFVGFVAICCHIKLPTKQIKINININML
jgi:hypothetical protein